MTSPFMNIEECAAYLRLSPRTLYQKVHKKEIPVRKHGRRLLFHRQDIDTWSEAQAKPVQKKVLSKFQEARLRLGK